MDSLPKILANPPWVEILILTTSIAVVLVVFNYTVVNDSTKQPVTFSAPVPKQCDPQWTGEVLEQPNIRVVSFDIHISCNFTNSTIRHRERVPYNATVLPMDDYSDM